MQIDFKYYSEEKGESIALTVEYEYEEAETGDGWTAPYPAAITGLEVRDQDGNEISRVISKELMAKIEAACMKDAQQVDVDY